MSDIKQDVKVFVKVFIQVFVSSVVKESTKRMINKLSKGQKKLLKATSKKMSDDQIVQYFDKSSFFKKTLENTIKSVCDFPSSKGTGSLMGKLESIYETTSYFNNPINSLILPASKSIVAVATSTAVLTAAVAIPFIYSAPSANFTSNVTEGYAPLSVQFTDLSENATGWNWDFGDGNNSSEKDPAHTYYAAGNYSAKLKASNENGTDSISAIIAVLEQPVLPFANFSSNVSEGYAPLSVQFNNSSESATELKWDFGDGNNSTDQNPAHSYFAAGTYNVNLTAINANGTDSTSVFIMVLEKTLPFANFSSNTTEGNAPLSVQFTDHSQNALSRNWDFGDGTNSTEQNPIHIYSAAGNYTLNLTATNVNGINSKLSTINVTKSIPAISWSSPVNITYGTALNSTQLNAKASVPGTFVYIPPSGTVLSAGTHTLYANFTPDDVTNYSNASSNVTINVTKSTPTITWSNPDDISYGTTLDNTQLNASSSVSGAFLYTPPSGTVLSASRQTLNVDFTPDDAANYSNTSSNVTISIKKATPVISWSNPADITYGTTLGSAQLDAFASVSGTFVYTPTAGTVLSAGTHKLHANFIPADIANYTTTSKDVRINVLKTTGTFAYIPNSGSDSVSVIDTATNTVIATVDVGSNPHGVAINPDGAKVYVTNSNSNNVSIIDTATNNVTSTVFVENSPYGVAVSPDGKKVYVTNLRSNSVSVINTATNQVTDNVSVGKWPEGVAFTPDGEKAYVTNYYSYSTISVIDTATNNVTAMVDPNIYGPSGIAISPDGKKAYVTSNFNDKVCIIDITSNQVTATIPVDSGPHGVAVSPDGKKVYVANGDSGTISVIDTITNNVTTTVLPVGSSPYGIAINPDGKTVYVPNYRSTDVLVIDTLTNNIIAVPVGNNPAAFGQFIGTIP